MPKQGYHHGNLREALMDAALRLIGSKGPTGFTLSEAAREAGVTPAAVYRHFDGRDALLAAIAVQGHGIFADLMDHAYDEGRPSALSAFEATGRAYLAFARRFPGHYIAMFESGLTRDVAPDLGPASDRSRAVLDRAAEGLSHRIPADRRPPPAMFTAHVWALAHGVVELFARGSAGAATPFPPEDLLETGIGIYLRGLGLIEGDGSAGAGPPARPG